MASKSESEVEVHAKEAAAIAARLSALSGIPPVAHLYIKYMVRLARSVVCSGVHA